MRVIICLLIFLLIGNKLFADDADLQFWNTYFVAWKIDDNLKMALDEELRFGEDVSRLVYEMTGLNLIDETIDWFNPQAYIRSGYLIKDDRKEDVSSIEGGFNLKKRFCTWGIFNRSLIGYRFLSHTRDFWRVRDKIKVNLIFPVKSISIEPFFSNEFFLDFDQPEFNFQRRSWGLDFYFNENFNASLYYLFQDSNCRSEEVKADAIGFELSYNF